AALARYPFLSRRERARVVRVAAALARVDRDDDALDLRSFGDWLSEKGESRAAVESLWDLIARPTLNLPAAEASLAAAAHVFQTALLSKAGAGDVGYARRPLSAVHGDPAEHALRAAAA